MVLGNGVFLKYVLREPDDGVVHVLGSGRIERDGLAGVNVYDEDNRVIEYLSGTHFRSWCVLGPNERRIDGWCEVELQDYQKILRGASAR